MTTAGARIPTAQRILDAAVELCEEEGPQGITMRRVGERVGLVAMAVYRHYRDKDAMLQAVADFGFRQLTRYVATVSDDATPLERLRAGRKRYLDFAVEHPNLYEMMFISRENRESLPREGEELPEAFSPLHRAVRSCVDARVFRTDTPRQIAMMIWALEHGFVQMYRSGLFPDERTFRTTVEAALEHLYACLAADSSKTAGDR